MKKLLALLLSLISVICIAFTLVGCGGIEVRGQFCTLKQAYENGWLDEDDLKSIACGYYDFNNFEENPYSGLYKEPTENLSEDIINELKQAYLEQIDNEPEGLPEKVKISKYYGVYSGNIVVKMWSEYFMCDIKIEDREIGGVIFKNFWQGEIRVYHLDQADGEKIETGTFYTVTEAYEKSLLTREQVLSIAYYHNKEYSFVEQVFYDDGLITNEEIRDENYIPLPITPQTLSAQTEKSIKQTHLDAYYKDKDYAKLSGVRIDSYYGTYNGCVAVMITDNYSGSGDVLWLEEVAGIGICYNNGNRITIWIKQ